MRPVTVLNASDRLVFTPKCKSGISELRSSISTPVRGQGPAVIVTTAVAQQAICHPCQTWLMLCSAIGRARLQLAGPSTSQRASGVCVVWDLASGSYCDLV